MEATVLFDAYRAWASERDLFGPSQKTFGTRLGHMGLSKARGPTGRIVYGGIRLLKDLNDSPLSDQESNNRVITEDPSEGSEVGWERADVAH